MEGGTTPLLPRAPARALINLVIMEERRIKVLLSRLKETTGCIQAASLPDFPTCVNATLQIRCPTKGPMLKAWSQLGTWRNGSFKRWDPGASLLSTQRCGLSGAMGVQHLP